MKRLIAQHFSIYECQTMAEQTVSSKRIDGLGEECSSFVFVVYSFLTPSNAVSNDGLHPECRPTGYPVYADISMNQAIIRVHLWIIIGFPFKTEQKVYNHNCHASIGRHDKP